MPAPEIRLTENGSLPVFLVVDEDTATGDALVSDLERRFAADYRVLGESSPGAALDRLAALHEAGGQVALIISRESMQAMSGSELLARSVPAGMDVRGGVRLHLRGGRAGRARG
jgi:CheY-like chemotaxis protein